MMSRLIIYFSIKKNTLSVTATKRVFFISLYVPARQSVPPDVVIWVQRDELIYLSSSSHFFFNPRPTSKLEMPDKPSNQEPVAVSGRRSPEFACLIDS